MTHTNSEADKRVQKIAFISNQLFEEFVKPSTGFESATTAYKAWPNISHVSVPDGKLKHRFKTYYHY